MNKVLQLAKIAQRSIGAHSPAILTGIGAAGVLTTALLTGHATIKAVRKVDAANSERRYPGSTANIDPIEDNDLTPIEVFQLVWLDYVPAFISAAGTVAAVIGSNQIASRRNAAVMSLYSVAQAGAEEWESKARGHLTPEQAQQIDDETAQTAIDRNPNGSAQIFATGSGRDLILDPQSGRYFYSTQESVQKAVNEINRRAMFESSASQNEFYSLLGLPRIGFGNQMGWRDDHHLEIDFGAGIAQGGEPCLVMNYRETPINGYWDPIKNMTDDEINFAKSVKGFERSREV